MIRNELQIELVSDPFDNRTYYDSRGHTLVDEGVREPLPSGPIDYEPEGWFRQPPPEPTDTTPWLPPEELIFAPPPEPLAPPEIAIIEPIDEVTVIETQPVIADETNIETVALEPPPGTTGVGTGGSGTPTSEPITRLTEALASLFPATNVSGGIRPSAYAPLGITQEATAASTGGNKGMILLLALAALAIGYYFWKKRGKKS